MRIACVYLPSFPLQAHVRQAPHLAGTSLVVADGALTGSVVMVCSRAAWAEGIRPGMAVATARTIVPELVVVAADRALYQRALDALVESLLGASQVVDTSHTKDVFAPHRVLYVKVPARSRGSSFGQKLLTQLSRLGFRGRVGVADDRFTAYVAAVRVEHRGRTSRLDDPAKQPLFHQSCTVIPRGGSAAFLAPLPLSYLPIDPDVQHLLETCGVKTLGDFAALPPPSVSRDWIEEDSDFQALARGQGPATLRAQAVDEVLARPLVERMDVQYELGDSQALAFALRALCEQVGQRLDGRARAARELALRLVGPGEAVTELALAFTHSTSSSAQLLEKVQRELSMIDPAHPVLAPVLAIELEVTRDSEPGIEPGTSELELFGAGLAAQPQPAVGMAAQQVEAFRRAEATHSGAARPHWQRDKRQPSRRRTPQAQQMLSFFE